MAATRFISDDVIDAIVSDRRVDAVHAPLMTFARTVRALGDGPAPQPSDELAALLEHGLEASTTPTKLAGVAARVAGLGIVAKVALGTSLAAASVGAAGAAGVLPATVNDAVRDAIESITPVDFDDHRDAPGSTPSSTQSTGDDDGGGGGAGVDDPQVADDGTGADHRPEPAVVDEPPGRSGETGLTRANETPAEPHAPDETPAGTTPAATAPSTVPDSGPPDDPGQGQAPESTPSTVPPARGDRAGDDVPGA